MIEVSVEEIMFLVALARVQRPKGCRLKSLASRLKLVSFVTVSLEVVR